MMLVSVTSRDGQQKSFAWSPLVLPPDDDAWVAIQRRGFRRCTRTAILRRVPLWNHPPHRGAGMRLRKITMIALTTLGLLAAGQPPVSAAAAHYYVSLGDSLSQGYQPGLG